MPTNVNNTGPDSEQDATAANIKNDIEELLGVHYDNKTISDWRNVGKDIVVDLMDGTTMTIEFKIYPEEI